MWLLIPSMICSYSETILLSLLSDPFSLSVYVHQMISGMTLPNAYRGFYFQEARFQVSSFLKNFLLYTFYSITLIYTGIYHVCQKSYHSKTFLLTLYTWRMYIY